MKIEVKNITKEFKKIKVIDNISYIFESGKIYGIYGRNGSGKSVFLKIICGFYIPTAGTVLIDRVDYSASNKYPPNLGVLIDKPSFFGDLTGAENLKLLAEIKHEISKDKIDEFLDLVNLTDMKNKKFRTYSLGMKQKVGIAQALMEDPDIIILDEPFNGIERESVKKICNYLNELKKNGKLIIVSSHIKDDLKMIADELIYFDNGHIEAGIDLDEV